VADTPDRSEDAVKRSEEAIKLVSDWAKWLTTVEMAITVAVGALFTSSRGAPLKVSTLAKFFSTVTIASFLVSIATAAILLLTLPEIMQKIDPNENVWYLRDSVLRISTQTLALAQSFFFGVGMISVSAMVITLIWT
jgi:hypothetical protein